MSASLLHRVVRGFAVYGLWVTLPFATPWTAGALLDVLRRVHEGLAPSGDAMPPFTPMHLFLVALFGVMAVSWALEAAGMLVQGALLLGARRREAAAALGT
ncbi:hypothetical protein [Corallococcus sp. EGB]|uniref:hypothetical protein n=1 Tax=Corallococcus sp. EGB TaxID=1521117 RepID=UPI001CBC9E8A|nr:hypothetical protein [Corallococcus sp. EGB]